MSQLTAEEIAAQIAALQAQLEDVKAREQREREAALVVGFFGFRMVRNDLKFAYRPRRQDVSDLLTSLGIEVPAAQTDLSIHPHQWDEIEKNLAPFPNIDLSNISDEMRETWRDYVPPPDVMIRFDKAGNYIIFENQPHVYLSSILDSHAFLGIIASIRNTGRKVLHPSNIFVLSDILNAIQRRYPAATIELDDEVKQLHSEYLKQQENIERLTDLDYVPTEKYVLNGMKFRDYQTQALELLKYNNGKAIIAPEMGLGKTPIAMAYIHECLKENPNSKFLVICPSSLRPNWSKEARKWIPDVSSIQLSGSIPSDFYVKELLLGNASIFYISYETLRTSGEVEDTNSPTKTRKVFPWSTILSHVPNLRVIADEAHYYKNPETSNAQSIFAIDNVLSITPLTGTPMKNGPKELHSLIKSVNPLLAGTYQGWVNMHTTDSGRRARNPEQLRKVLAPYLFRRLKRDVIKELPPINRITLEYELSAKAKLSYLDVLNGFYQQLDKWNGDRSDSHTINGLLAQLIRMKQVCAEDKIDFVAERALETFDADESNYRKVIIFSQFANSPPIVEKIAKKLGGESLWFTGQHSNHERFALVEQFQSDPSINFLVASTKAAMEGLTITAAGHIIFTDLMWTPADHQQAEGRAYGRMNDLHSISSTYVVAADTIEEQIVELLFSKVKTIAQVIDGATDESSIAMDVLALLKSQRG